MKFYTYNYVLLLVLHILLQNLCLANKSKTFLYFAYGSNLLAKRIHINNPSAVRIGYGQLKKYRLDFNLYSNRWKGASATVVPSKNNTVWGAIWEIDSNTLKALDKQEGVDKNIYFPIEKRIEGPNGTHFKCRLYQQCQTPSKLEKGEILPKERQPSTIYLDTIIKGAAESNLPKYYQSYLKTIPSNGYKGKVNLGR